MPDYDVTKVREAYKDLQFLFDYTLITGVACKANVPIVSDLLGTLSAHLNRALIKIEDAHAGLNLQHDTSLRSVLTDDVNEYVKTGNDLVAYAAVLKMNAESGGSKYE